MDERIPLVDADDDGVDDETRATLRGMREIGADFNVIRALANHPGLLDGFMRFSAAAYWGSSVPSDLRELAYLTASNENHCHY
jgi:alkylhydroperoxidase family enzyme